MVSTAVSPIIALLLAISMLLSPAAGLTSDMPRVSVSIDSQGESVGLGLVDTTAGQPAAYLTHGAEGLYLTGSEFVLVADGQTVSVPAAELLAQLSAAVGALPQPTEEDLNALMYLAQGLLTSVSSEALSFAPTANGFTCKINLDRLCRDLDAAVPKTLTNYATYLDPTVTKYSAALLGQPLTCAQLAAAWPQLGLSSVSTGFTAQLTVMQQNDGSISLLGSVCNVNFIGKVGANGLDLRVTTPDGVSYQLDTNDLIALANVLAQLPSYITADAFSIAKTHTINENYDDIYTYTIKLDTTALARDLNNGIASLITNNGTSVDTLVEKYRSWIGLIDADFAANLSADALANYFNQGVISLPAITGEMVIVDNTYLYTAEINGSIDKLNISGKVHYQERLAASLLFTIDNRWLPEFVNVDFYYDDYHKALATISSSTPIFFGTNSLTFSYNDNWTDTYVLSTDNNVFRLAYSGDEQYVELKIDELFARFSMDDDDGVHLNVTLPDFFASVHTSDDNFNLDTPYFGLDYSDGHAATVITGYVQESYYDDRIAFSLDVNHSTNLMTAYIRGGYQENYSLIVADYNVIYTDPYNVYTFTPDYEYNATSEEGKAYIIARNGKPTATITGVSDGDVTTVYVDVTTVYVHGLETTATPATTIVMNTAPEAITLPANATVVDAATFLNLLHQFLQ